MRLTAIAIVFAMMPAGAFAQWASIDQILEACQEHQAYLAGYLTGTLNYGEAIHTLDEQVGRQIEPTICVPKGATIGDVSEKFCAYIEGHPERQGWPLGLLSHVALSQSYPCQ